MSAILDALKKAQKDNRRPGVEGLQGLNLQPESKRKIVYWIVAALVFVVCGLIVVSFAYRSKMLSFRADTTPNRAADAGDVRKDRGFTSGTPSPAISPAVSPKKEAAPPAAASSLSRNISSAARGERDSHKEAVMTPTGQAASAKEKTVREEKQLQSDGTPYSGSREEGGAIAVRKKEGETSANRYNAALKAEERGDDAEARRLYLAVLAERPHDVESLNNLGVMAMRKGKSEEALFYFRKILEMKRDHGKAFNNIGLILFKEGDKVQAENCFKKAIESNPNSIEPYLNLSALMRSDKRLSDASNLLGVLIKRGEKDPSVHLSYAIIRDELGQKEDAIRHYRYYLRAAAPPSDNRKKIVERLKVIEGGESAESDR